MEKNDKLKKVITVNVITASRGVIGSTLIKPIFTSFGGFFAAITSAIFMLTDKIDGSLAKKWKVKTFFGRLLDPVCDKIFAIVSFAILAGFSPIFLIPLLVEVIIWAINGVSFLAGKQVKSSFIGRLKTVILGATIPFGFLGVQPETVPSFIKNGLETQIINIKNMDINQLALAIISPVLIAQGITAVNYIYKAIRTPKVDKQDEFANMELKSGKEIWENLVDTEFALEHDEEENLLKLMYKPKKNETK